MNRGGGMQTVAGEAFCVRAFGAAMRGYIDKSSVVTPGNVMCEGIEAVDLPGDPMGIVVIGFGEGGYAPIGNGEDKNAVG